tara:strand:- start:401 stop:961 length:561 start_codon:yes stop_codon:yes gene_type:complete
MKKLLGVLVLIFISSLFNKPLYANEKFVQLLKDGGKVVFIRHAYAPGNGDPHNFDIKNCSTQRNLNNNGIAQSKNIGNFFSKNNIQIDKVLSSEWCRCKDTAQHAFKTFETFNALNSFYDPRFEKNKSIQVKNLKKFINNWNSSKNLILVTHFVVISEILGIGVSSGEIVVSDKNLSIQGTLVINR